MLGGVHGLEESLSSDFALSATVHDPRELFDVYLNVCPDQGSGTIRTEVGPIVLLVGGRDDFFFFFCLVSSERLSVRLLGHRPNIPPNHE